MKDRLPIGIIKNTIQDRRSFSHSKPNDFRSSYKWSKFSSAATFTNGADSLYLASNTESFYDPQRTSSSFTQDSPTIWLQFEWQPFPHPLGRWLGHRRTSNELNRTCSLWTHVNCAWWSCCSFKCLSILPRLIFRMKIMRLDQQVSSLSGLLSDPSCTQTNTDRGPVEPNSSFRTLA